MINYTKELKELLKNFYFASGGIGISIFELESHTSVYYPTLNYFSRITYPDDPMEGRFCALLRISKCIDDRCIKCDQYAWKVCIKSGEPYIYNCHLGFLEALIPVKINDRVVALLTFGNVSEQPITDGNFRNLYNILKNIDSDNFLEEVRGEYQKIYDQLIYMTKERFKAYCAIMSCLSRNLAGSNYICVVSGNTIEDFNLYLNKNIGRRILIKDVCDSLHISNSKLFRSIKKYNNMSFSEYVNRFKMERARKLLNEQRCSVKETANLLGYVDVNYFSRIFKHINGCSPTNYVKEKFVYNIEAK